jgi:hypothetical protein
VDLSGPDPITLLWLLRLMTLIILSYV